jgi:putative ABC transport system permease protein
MASKKTMRLQTWLESILQDLRYTLRGFGRSPAPFWIAVTTMALGVGGVTAVFSVVDRILLRDLPYAHQDRLVWLGMKAPINNNEFLLEGDFSRFVQNNQVFDSMGAIGRVNDCDLNEQDSLRLACAQVTASFLPTLGLGPQIGRNFTPQEDAPNGPRAALLTHGFWQRRYGADPQAIGRTMVIDGRPAQIVGVLPAEFEMPTLARVDVLLPAQLNLSPGRTGISFLTVFGRLKSGISVQQAEAALHPIFLECLRFVPPGFIKEVTFHITRLRDRQVRDYRVVSMVLLACALIVLLIACANVSNLLLARAATRRREWAVRAAIGAGRGRLVRQTLTESLALSAVGGGAGLLVAAVLLRGLLALAPEGIPRLQEAALDGRILLFALAASAGCGILFGCGPALRLPRAATLNTARAAPGGSGLRHALVAIQIGLSFVLLSAAGLLLQSLWKMQQVPLGIQPEQVLTVRLQLGTQRYPGAPQQAEFFEQTAERVQRVPGLRAVALSDSVPLAGPSNTMIFSNIEIEGRAKPAENRATGGMTIFRTVTPAYFAAMGITILRGRGFTELDRTSGEQVVIIGESMARRLFAGEDPLGRRMRSGFSGPWRTIVGIAHDVKNAGLTGTDDPEYYYLWRKGPEGGRRIAHLILRSEADPGGLASMVRANLAELDPTLPVTVTTMGQNLGKLMERPRFESFLLSLFAGIGVLLAAIGQFGVISYLVTQRSAEIGVRMALGATGRHVAGLVIRRMLAWTLIGAGLGLVVAWFGGRYLESLLFGVRARDLVNFAAVFGFLIVVSLAAAWQPLLRAVRVDPAQVLRHE